MNAMAYYLSEADVLKLRRFIALVEEWTSGGETPSSRNYGAPDVYIAEVPGSGIPARSGKTPGSATCNIYRINDSDQLEPITTLTKKVYNLSTNKIDTEYALVVRAKTGSGSATNLQAPKMGSS